MPQSSKRKRETQKHDLRHHEGQAAPGELRPRRRPGKKYAACQSLGIFPPTKVQKIEGDTCGKRPVLRSAPLQGETKQPQPLKPAQPDERQPQAGTAEHDKRVFSVARNVMPAATRKLGRTFQVARFLGRLPASCWDGRPVGVPRDHSFSESASSVPCRHTPDALMMLLGLVHECCNISHETASVISASVALTMLLGPSRECRSLSHRACPSESIA